MTLPPVVILGGGLGTRLDSITKGVPKILTEIAGKTFIEWKIESLAKQGVPSIFLLLGHGADQVIEHLNVTEYKIPVATIVDGPNLLGTGGALKRASDLLPPYFVLTFGDNLLTEPLRNFASEAEEGWRNKLVITEFVGIADKRNISVSEAAITKYAKESFEEATHTDYGYATIVTDDLVEFKCNGSFDLNLFWSHLISLNKLDFHLTNERYFEIGTPYTFFEVENWLTSSHLN